MTKPYLIAVDDEPINRFILEDVLEGRFELTVLESGQACLDSVQKRKPDLILLDINMPGIDGFEVCQRLQQTAATADIPVLFLTARLAVEDEKRGLETGAVDYITKPFSESLLMARIETHLSLSQSRRLLAQHNAQLNNERRYIESVILKMREDEHFVHDNLKCLVAPLDKTNGDLVLSSRSANGNRYLLVGDFTGHGLAAALGGPLVSSLFYMLSDQGAPLEQILYKLNEALYRKMPPDMFMAAILLEWQEDNGCVVVWNFGMSELLHFRECELIDSVSSSCFALGIQSHQCRLTPTAVLQVESGDSLFCYSDGVVETRSVEGDLFGVTRLKQHLQTLLQEGYELHWLNQKLEVFSEQNGLADDVTLVQVLV
ncbi:fused response regulator/phosphatase [Thiomicrorhabdus sp. zzn3]|uniref:fused response regulator/phosphatase n=1 Tax=Thiomicrorhabdus sp. zzn3 TaxID=3039775 RepID=UPI00243687DE|nr:fused response regulator/phosphatase [Thiomicrorhabdus sp. zzn3]MDG6777835.1 fused response regulator/phosphatase [Thiomicrorhabdus sp. zzn3]